MMRLVPALAGIAVAAGLHVGHRAPPGGARAEQRTRQASAENDGIIALRKLARGTNVSSGVLSSLLAPPTIERIRKLFQEVPIELKDEVFGVRMANASVLPMPGVCTVVANSRSALLPEAGRKIDADGGFVMRFNKALTEGYEPYVGHRTDILVVNDQVPCIWRDTSSGPEDGIRYVLLNDFGFTEGPGFLKKECVESMVQQFPDVSFLALDFPPINGAIQRIMDEAPGKELAELMLVPPPTPWISTGFVGLAFLLNLCQEVRHYGFLPASGDASADCAQHYWKWKTPAEGGKLETADWSGCEPDPVHRLGREHVLWSLLSSPGEGVIRGWPGHHPQAAAPVPVELQGP